ncbi:hypothetical protein V2J09_018472 [Rumex salicifolius]
MYTSNDANMISKFKDSMRSEFEMIDLCKMRWRSFKMRKEFSSLNKSMLKMFWQGSTCLTVTLFTILWSQLRRFLRLKETQQVDATGYKQLIGPLLYITATRPNIMYSIYPVPHQRAHAGNKKSVEVP